MSSGAGVKIAQPFNRYVMQARVMPALIVVLPVILALCAWISKVDEVLRPLGTLLVTMGTLLILAQLARTAGKRAERDLVHQWGALPSTILLRHRDPTLNVIDKQRYHAALGKLVPGVQMPTAAQEEAAPQAADDTYEACCTWLRSRTTDEKKFHRLFEENISYGFRRNLYGLRVAAISSAAIGIAACVFKILLAFRTHSSPAPIEAICGIACIGLGAAFIILLTPAIVREAGDDYASRLLATIDELSVGKLKSQAASTKKGKDAKA